jgi:hypothetical protein
VLHQFWRHLPSGDTASVGKKNARWNRKVPSRTALAEKKSAAVALQARRPISVNLFA